MKGLGKKQIERILIDLKEALKASKLEYACFGDKEMTDKIREITKLYRDTWIIYYLSDVIDYLDLCIKKPSSRTYTDWFGCKKWKDEIQNKESEV